MDLQQLENIVRIEASKAYKRVSDFGSGVASEEDFRQEGWTVALRVYGLYDPTRSQLPTFISNCVRNHLNKMARKVNKRDYIGISSNSVAETTIIEYEGDLSPQELEIWHKFIEPNDIDDIATIMGLPKESVKERLRQICEKLKS